MFSVAFLDNQHQLLTFSKLFFGTINSASVHPRVVVQRCLEVNAAAIMLAHNHPSGVTTPSDADIRITRRIADAVALVDIRLLDHVIVGEGEAQSMARLGML